MNTDDRTRLQAERFRLESALLATEKALEALPPLTGHGERARLSAEMQALLTEPEVVNTKLSTLRGRACST